MRRENGSRARPPVIVPSRMSGKGSCQPLFDLSTAGAKEFVIRKSLFVNALKESTASAMALAVSERHMIWRTQRIKS